MLSVGTIRLKIGSVLAERVRQGEVGGCTALGNSAWRVLQLPVEKPWSALGGPFFCFLAQAGVDNTCRDSISGILGSFWSGGAFSGWRALTVECSLVSGCS